MRLFEFIKFHAGKVFIGLCFVCICMPLVVHIFSPDLDSEITADGLLGYVIQGISAFGTILLAYVAIWQNQKMQQDNDKAQNRMENIALEANNLNIIAKIIEHEQNNHTNLKSAIDEFSEACNLQTMVEDFGGSISHGTQIEVVIAKMMLRVDNSFFALGRELRIKPDLLKEDKNPLNKTMVTYYMFAKEFLDKYKELSPKELQDYVRCFELIRENFFAERENYLVEQETKLNKLIYGKLSLEEIKDMYRFYEKREGK